MFKGKEVEIKDCSKKLPLCQNPKKAANVIKNEKKAVDVIENEKKDEDVIEKGGGSCFQKVLRFASYFFCLW